MICLFGHHQPSDHRGPLFLQGWMVQSPCPGLHTLGPFIGRFLAFGSFLVIVRDPQIPLWKETTQPGSYHSGMFSLCPGWPCFSSHPPCGPWGSSCPSRSLWGALGPSWHPSTLSTPSRQGVQPLCYYFWALHFLSSFSSIFLWV